MRPPLCLGPHRSAPSTQRSAATALSEGRWRVVGGCCGAGRAQRRQAHLLVNQKRMLESGARQRPGLCSSFVVRRHLMVCVLKYRWRLPSARGSSGDIAEDKVEAASLERVAKLRIQLFRKFVCPRNGGVAGVCHRPITQAESLHSTKSRPLLIYLDTAKVHRNPARPESSSNVKVPRQCQATR